MNEFRFYFFDFCQSHSYHESSPALKRRIAHHETLQHIYTLRSVPQNANSSLLQIVLVGGAKVAGGAVLRIRQILEFGRNFAARLRIIT